MSLRRMGIAIPGASLVCPDSHTASLGAMVIGLGESGIQRSRTCDGDAAP